jgi:hypothetical protein
MLTEAARQTNKVVRNPAACPYSPRLTPFKIPETSVSAHRNAISGHSSVMGIFNFS